MAEYKEPIKMKKSSKKVTIKEESSDDEMDWSGVHEQTSIKMATDHALKVRALEIDLQRHREVMKWFAPPDVLEKMERALANATGQAAPKEPKRKALLPPKEEPKEEKKQKRESTGSTGRHILMSVMGAVNNQRKDTTAHVHRLKMMGVASDTWAMLTEEQQKVYNDMAKEKNAGTEFTTEQLLAVKPAVEAPPRPDKPADSDDEAPKDKKKATPPKDEETSETVYLQYLLEKNKLRAKKEQSTEKEILDTVTDKFAALSERRLSLLEALAAELNTGVEMSGKALVERVKEDFFKPAEPDEQAKASAADA
jgi:hypothetical protein